MFTVYDRVFIMPNNSIFNNLAVVITLLCYFWTFLPLFLTTKQKKLTTVEPLDTK